MLRLLEHGGAQSISYGNSSHFAFPLHPGGSAVRKDISRFHSRACYAKSNNTLTSTLPYPLHVGGFYGLLFLLRTALASATLCRFIPAHGWLKSIHGAQAPLRSGVAVRSPDKTAQTAT